MKISVSERTRSAALIIPAVLVLMVMAALLYRWSNQVSEATSVRLADSLQMSMVNWHLNLFRDLSDICLAMRVDPDERADLDPYVRRFVEWRTAAPIRSRRSFIYSEICRAALARPAPRSVCVEI